MEKIFLKSITNKGLYLECIFLTLKINKIKIENTKEKKQKIWTETSQMMNKHMKSFLASQIPKKWIDIQYKIALANQNYQDGQYRVLVRM